MKMLTVLVPFVMAASLPGFPGVQKIGDSIVDSQALTIQGFFGQAINGLSFQQDAVITHDGWQYAAYYNGNRRVCLARRQLPAGNWQTIEFGDYNFTSDDAHNTISLGICPNDGTIHLAFDHHGHTLHYRASQTLVASRPADVVWSASLFGPIRSYLEEGKSFGLTYPAFLQTPDGDMLFIFRSGGSGNGDWLIVDYDGSTQQWSNTRKFISRSGTFTDEYNTSTSRCAYPNYYTFGPNGKLHVTWCWREGTQGANHDIMYSYSEDKGYTWLNCKDSALKISVEAAAVQTLLRLKGAGDSSAIIGLATGNAATEKLIRVDSPGVTVVNVPRRYGMINTQAQAVDSHERVHVVVWRCTDESIAEAARLGYTGTYRWGHPYARRYHHYWRDTDGAWRHHEMQWVAGNRPKMFIRPNGDAFLIYSASRKPENMWADAVQFIDGDLKIAAANADSNWTDWQVIHTEEGPFVNEMLADPVRFQQEGILSVMVQQSPSESGQSTPLRIVDFLCR